MPGEEVKLTIAEQLYPGSDSTDPPKLDEGEAKAPEKSDEKTDKEPDTPQSPDGQVDDDPKPPTSEGAKDELDPSNLDWMDKELPQGQPDDEGANESVDPSVKVKYAGRELTLGELQEETSKLESGYTKKQMALAEKQKQTDEILSANEKKQAELVTSLTEVQNYLQSVVQQEPDWEKLKDELDTDEFLLKKMEFEETKQNLKKVADNRQVLVQKELDKKASKEMGILARDFYPEWKDPKVCEKHIASVISYNEKSYGYEKSELKHIMYDNRLFRMAADAASWRKHKEALKKIADNKTADNPPTTVKASGGTVKEPDTKGKKKDIPDILYPQYNKESAVA